MRFAGSLNSDSLVMGFYKTSVPSRADHRAPSYWYAASSFLLQEMPTVRATQGIRQLRSTCEGLSIRAQLEQAPPREGDG